MNTDMNANMGATAYPNYRQRQGIIFCYTLTNTRLWLMLFRIFPLGCVRLSRIKTMRTASSREFFELNAHRLFLWWKYWHWPYPLNMVGRRGITVYLLETHDGGRVFVRLKPGIHYMLRTLMNEA
jgi:hypothetical protein